MKIDLHNHTEYSFDSKLSMEESISIALGKGIDIFGFSDHLDFATDDPGADFYRAEEQYREFCMLRDKFSNSIQLHLGIEASYESYYYERTKAVIADIPFEYIIMSVHFVQGKVMSQWVKSIEEGKSHIDDVDYSPYFKQMKELVTEADFDILGHMDYYKKYSRFSHENTFERYSKQIRDIIHILCDRGKIPEINTSGLRYSCNEQFPSEDYLKLYRESGGRAVSIGSDSHKEEHIGYCIDKALNIADRFSLNIYKPEALCQE